MFWADPDGVKEGKKGPRGVYICASTPLPHLLRTSRLRRRRPRILWMLCLQRLCPASVPPAGPAAPADPREGPCSPPLSLIWSSHDGCISEPPVCSGPPAAPVLTSSRCWDFSGGSALGWAAHLATPLLAAPGSAPCGPALRVRQSP